MNIAMSNIGSICHNRVNFTSAEKEYTEEEYSSGNNSYSLALMGLALLGAATLQSCDQEVAMEAFNDCPYQETVFTTMPLAKQRVDYVFQNLGILPKGKSVVDADSICFSDKNNNRIQLLAPRDSAGYVKMDMKKISPSGEIKNGEALVSNWGDRKLYIEAPLMPAHHKAHLFQSEFWDEPGRKQDTFTEIRNESGDQYYNHYCVERINGGFQSRAAKGRGDDSKTETYTNVKTVLK